VEEEEEEDGGPSIQSHCRSSGRSQ